jgi:hypothetical protein
VLLKTTLSSSGGGKLRRILQIAIGLGAFALAAMPCAASSFLAFNEKSGTGCWNGGPNPSSPGCGAAGSQIASWDINTISDGANTYTISSSADYLVAVLNANTGLFTISTNGTANTFGLGNNVVIYSATTTLTGSNGNFTLSNFNFVSMDATFIADLQTAAYNNVLPAGTPDLFTLAGTTSQNFNQITSTTIDFTPAPEPTSISLLGAGLAAAVIMRRRRNNT